MIVREIQTGEEQRWDQFVQQHPFGTSQHLIGWKKVMQDAFKSKTHFLLAEENGSIRGVLPLIHVKSLLAGHYLTSLPGGICADDEETARALFDHAREMVIANKARYLILRDGRKEWPLPDVVTNTDHVTFMMEIPSNLEQLKPGMNRRTKQLIHKVSDNGLAATIGLECLDSYYPAYAKAMQSMGTPTLGLDFFKLLAQQFPRGIDLIHISYQGKVVGGGFFAPYGSTIYCLWSGLLQEYYHLHTAYLLVWETLRYAHQNKYKCVDLGRCKKDTGGHDFKRRFGGREQQLYQQIYLNGIEKPPDVGAERKTDILFRTFTAIWRILPLPITELVGPFLRRQIPFG